MQLNITQFSPLGAHFVAWSLAFLSGQDRYLNDAGKWEEMPTSVMDKHTSHKFKIPEGLLGDVSGLLDDGLNIMFVLFPDSRGFDVVSTRNVRIQHMERMIKDGWRSVVCHDFDLASDIPESGIRQSTGVDIDDAGSRNRVLIERMGRVYPDHVIDRTNIDHFCLHQAHRSSKFKVDLDDMVRQWADAGMVQTTGVNELLSGDTAVFERLLTGLGLQMHSDRLDDWRVIQAEWASKNNFSLTWRGMVAGWCGAIVANADLEMPALDHYQLAVVQRHLMINHGRRLRSQECHDNAQGYYGNLHHG